MNRAPTAREIWVARDFPARLELVDELCREIRHSLNGHGLELIVFGAELVARECLNNAVLHGSEKNPQKMVHLALFRCGEHICLQVADEGPGFNWRKACQAPLADENATSGRGLAIVSSYTERVHFNQQGNIITLWLRNPGADKPKAYG